MDEVDDTNAVVIHVNENCMISLISWMNVCAICLMTGTLRE
jgi:hypothetical protein